MTKKTPNPEYAQSQKGVDAQKKKLTLAKKAYSAKFAQLRQLCKDSKKTEESLQKIVKSMATASEELDGIESLNNQLSDDLASLIGTLKETPKYIEEY